MYVSICKDTINSSHFISSLCSVMHLNKIQFSHDLSEMLARDVKSSNTAVYMAGALDLKS